MSRLQPPEADRNLYTGVQTLLFITESQQPLNFLVISKITDKGLDKSSVSNKW